MKFHELANIFPLMDDEQLKELASDIQEHGLIEPIWTWQDEIVDGRNRFLACEMVNVIPDFREWDGQGSLIAFIVSLNLKRRHLNESQRAMVAARISNIKHGEIGRGHEKSEGQICTSEAASLLNISERTVKTARKVQSQGIPEIQHKVDSGKLPVSTASAIAEMTKEEQEETLKLSEKEILKKAKEIRKKKTEERRAKNEQLKSNNPLLVIDGTYDVIVIDPPWPIQKIDRELRPNQTSELDYPIMSIEEIGKLSLPAANDCHIFLWTTHKFLPIAFELLAGWGLKYICTFVWHKPGGFQPYGLPQYNCEFVLYARRGTPQFSETKNFPVCFNGLRGKHSEKPGEFYETLRRVTNGQRLDMFGRRKIEGFNSWGNEVE